MRLVLEGSLFALPAVTWIAFLLGLFVKSMVLLAGVHLMAPLISRQPGSQQSRFWTIVFGFLLGLTVISTVDATEGGAQSLARWSPKTSILQLIQVDRAPEAAIVTGGAPLRETADAGSFEESPDASEASSSPAEPGFRGFLGTASRYWACVAVVWILGVCFRFIRTVNHYCRGWKIIRSSPVAGDNTLSESTHRIGRRLGLRSPVGLHRNSSISTPFVSGILRPTLVLPDSVRDLDRDLLEMVLTHELAHVKRRDIARLIFLDLLCALYWPNPLVWASANRAKLAFEMACDDIVCRKRSAGVRYVRQLVRFARPTAPAEASHGSPRLAGIQGLEARIGNILGAKELEDSGGQALLQARFHKRPTLSWTVGCIAALFVILTAVRVTAMHPAHSFQEPVVTAVETAKRAPERDPDGRFEPRRSVSTGESIHSASARGDLEKVSGFIGSDPDLLNAPDESGMTPLALAAWNDHPDLVRYLAGVGADPDIRNQNGLTPLFCAVDRSRYALARLLINVGADIATRGHLGRTLLHMSSRSGDIGLSRILLDRGASVNAGDSSGATPLDIAVWYGHTEIADLLELHGAIRSHNEPPTYLRTPKIRGF